MKTLKQRIFNQITLILIYAVLSVVVTACNRANTQTLSETSGTQTAENYVSDESYASNESYAKILNGDLSDFVEIKAILEIYKKILLNQTGFFDEDNRVVYLRDFNYKQFAVLDMNLYADGIPELVLQNMTNGDILVLHYYEGAVYGKVYGYRAIRNLKIDGFFDWSNSVYNSGLGKLNITGKDQEIINMAEYGSLMEDVEMYRIQGNPVSLNEFNDYTAFQNAKEDIVWHNLTNENINNLTSLNIIPQVPSFPPSIDYFQYVDFKPMFKHSDLRFWGWSKDSKVAYTINKSLDPMEGNIFSSVIFDTIDDIIVWQDSLNSNDYKENEYNAAFNNFIKSFMSRAGQNKIEFLQADFKGLPIRHINQVVNIIVETSKSTGDWHEVYGNIGSYKIIANKDGRRKIIHEKTLDRPVMDIVSCGYFINPFDNRALIIVGEYKWAFEGYDVGYVLIGCHLSTGFR